jgi:hypothetical protein
MASSLEVAEPLSFEESFDDDGGVRAGFMVVPA